MWVVSLPVVLLFSYSPTLAQVHVRVWQPNTDSSKIKEPSKFRDLAERRPISTATTKPGITTQETINTIITATTSTTTDISTTNTVLSTVQWASPTTVNVCGETDPMALIESLKDSGIYNEIYMAPDIFTASRNFPDLGGRNFMKAKSRYHCDDTCERSSELVRLVMIGDEPTEPPSKESEHSWWSEDQWTRGKRTSFTSTLSRGGRRHELENNLRNLLRELDQIDGDNIQETGKHSEQEEFDRFFASKLHRETVLPTRRKRSSNAELTARNSGLAKDIIGTTIALECRNKYDDHQSGYHLCSSCRAVRHLPRTYFPRILNEVICGESTCVRGDGRCAQRFLPLKNYKQPGSYIAKQTQDIPNVMVMKFRFYITKELTTVQNGAWSPST
ncbi:hypothetical protein DICVIV_10163 [Dictyocaulus viviparus]|uniref:Uncharacterized protein n=1 Tax=Dictyocaulus viviparus TaxID=29172 RepID=A0A0D8XN73_DICVI|nr:hypothetical protein DICVIV_10163 [Dictyocaulus viviparus]